MALQIMSDGKFSIDFQRNSFTTPKKVSEVNEWHQWCLSYNGTTNERKIYRDGKVVGEDIASEDFLGKGSVYIGRSPWGGEFYGAIDDVRIYNGALSEKEVTEIYQQEKKCEENSKEK